MNRINGIDLPERTVYENLWFYNKNNMEVPALEYFSNQFTYSDFKNEIDYYAKAFLNIGIKQGNIVTLCMPSMLEFILAYYALNAIGATANGISINFLRNNLKKYTDEKNSNTLVILDDYYRLIESQLECTNISNIILASLNYYKNGDCSKKYQIISNYSLVNHINYYSMDEFITMGKHDNCELKVAKFDPNRISTLLYTSGTTADPKCVAFNDNSINALVSMHDRLEFNDNINFLTGVGDRSLLIIPPYYATSLLYSINLQLSRGKTIIPEPIYNKYTFGDDLKNLRINHTVASGSHYAALKYSDLKPGDLCNLKFPASGGEGIPLALADNINDILKKYGALDRLLIGGGSSELGSSVYASYNVDRTNETGIALPGVFTKIIDPETGREVKPGERGIMVISSPNAMVEYYQNPEATSDYFTVDDDGIRWGHPNDIGIKNDNGTFTMLGRAKDSYYSNSAKKRIYMFDTEEEVSKNDSVYEVEAVALSVDNNSDTCQVVHIVINPECNDSLSEIVKTICSNGKIKGVKFRTQFNTSSVTGKRDYQSLVNERTGFYYYDNGIFYERSFPEDFPVIDKTIIEEEIVIKNEEKSKPMILKIQ